MKTLHQIISRLKFIVKIQIISKIRTLLLFFFGVAANKKNWKERILIVNLEGLGDIVMLTSVLKHYKKFLPDKKLYFLATAKTGLRTKDLEPWIDELITIDYPAFTRNPFYGLKFINNLRKIGFSKVINHDPSAAEIIGKIISVSLGAEKIIGYEGFGLQLRKAFDPNMAKNLSYVKKNLHSHYTTIVPSFDKNMDLTKRLPNFIHHYAAIFKEVTGKLPPDFAPCIIVREDAEKKVLTMLFDHGIVPRSYAILTLGTATPHREWGVGNFAKVARLLKERDISIVLVGSKKEAEMGLEFEKYCDKKCLNLIGKTMIPEVFALMKNSLFSLSNDTAPVHIAVALKKPCVGILGLGHFGMLSLYGYPDINHWVYSSEKCLCDNWRCIHAVEANEPTPCISAIKVGDVSKKLIPLLDYLRGAGPFPKTSFQIEFKDIQ